MVHIQGWGHMSNDIIFESATELAEQIKNKKISSLELTQAYIDQIEKHDEKILSLIHI